MFSQNKQVAFAVRTNVSYESSAGDNSPSLDKTVSFAMKDFLHIKEVRCLCHPVGGTLSFSVQDIIIYTDIVSLLDKQSHL